MKTLKRLNARQLLILKGIASDVETFAAMKPRFEVGSLPCVTERYRIREAQSGLAFCNASKWLGKERLSPSDAVSVSRGYRTLETLGLVERYALGDNPRRTTHLSLTAAGRELVGQLRTAESPIVEVPADE